MRHNLSLTNQLISHWIPGAVKVVFFLAVIIKLVNVIPTGDRNVAFFTYLSIANQS